MSRDSKLALIGRIQAAMRSADAHWTASKTWRLSVLACTAPISAAWISCRAEPL